MSPLLPSAFVRALQVNDSLFPTGSFAFSDGLEAAVTHNRVCDGESLGAWMQFYLDAVLPACDGPALMGARRAGEDWTALAAIDAELTAIRPAGSMRAASRLLGRRLLATWRAAYPSAGLAEASDRIARGELAGNFPIAYGLVCAAAGIDERSMVLGFGYGRLAATASAALRLMAIGQEEAQRRLASHLDRLPAVAEAVVARGACRLRSFAPALDIEQMAHEYVYSRLFRS